MLIKSIQKFLGIEESGFFDQKTKKAWTDYCHKTPGMVFYASQVPNKDYLPKSFLERLERATKKKVKKTQPKLEPKKEEPKKVETKEPDPAPEIEEPKQEKPAKIVVFGDVVSGEIIVGDDGIVADTKYPKIIDPDILVENQEPVKEKEPEADMVSDEIVEVKVEEVKELPKKRGRKKKN